MSLSRRMFVQTLGVGVAGALSSTVLAAGGRSGRGFWAGVLDEAAASAGARPIPLHNNENPLGPGPRVLEAVRTALGNGASAGRYPGGIVRELMAAIGEANGVPAEYVMVGNGSTQILRTATHVYTAPDRPLVSGSPSYEESPEYAELIGSPVRAIPLDATLSLDLSAMAAASKGAGLVFLCNPNNPTATVHSGTAMREFIDQVLRASPETTIAIDEAYHDYVTDPSYATMIPLARENPRVMVARTFSKAHGMAGLRVGYLVGHPETLKPMRQWHYGNSLNVLGVAAALASIRDPGRIEKERARNTDARGFTLRWFEEEGYKATDSQANFIFVDLRQPLPGFRDACRERGVLVGRPFPPLTTSARISIGTLEEMQRATEVFGDILGAAKTSAAA